MGLYDDEKMQEKEDIKKVQEITEEANKTYNAGMEHSKSDFNKAETIDSNSDDLRLAAVNEKLKAMEEANMQTTNALNTMTAQMTKFFETQQQAIQSSIPREEPKTLEELHEEDPLGAQEKLIERKLQEERDKQAALNENLQYQEKALDRFPVLNDTSNPFTKAVGKAMASYSSKYNKPTLSNKEIYDIANEVGFEWQTAGKFGQKMENVEGQTFNSHGKQLKNQYTDSQLKIARAFGNNPDEVYKK